MNATDLGQALILAAGHGLCEREPMGMPHFGQVGRVEAFMALNEAKLFGNDVS